MSQKIILSPYDGKPLELNSSDAIKLINNYIKIVSKSTAQTGGNDKKNTKKSVSNEIDLNLVSLKKNAYENVGK